MSRRKHSSLVIAHRGASGYLPEHTLAAKALAHGMGADFIEQDVVLSRDGIPVVLHDIHLDSTTDVARHFPERARRDGRYYAIDFTLQEIRSLRVHERTQLDAEGRELAVFPGRFPLGEGSMGVPTLAEEIELIAGLDRSRARRTGLYVELKAPRFHRQAGHDIAAIVLSVLAEQGYAERPEQVFLQCFDDQSLRYLQRDLKCELPLIQLIADSSWGEDSAVDYDWLRSPAGLREIASYAAGIGPWLMQIYLGKDANGQPILSNLVEQAHAEQLLVHPYTFRSDQLPPGIEDYNELLALFIDTLGVDGIFTDFPDSARHYIDQQSTGA
ncbi:glycerophosphodiester phosphodiesterase [Parahaliea sp. F7430]|uniref:glycerophosphodiester phosphodiesterase n=1 Tax=Sediminihaliea albiluteola TaxID=2758564 RepID=A0A7W2TX01_9GAMM|nr:glycerophosphodiester phosphodiesterase [Sediminihaliea albiluteola]MBA6413506.1 glycerophosphodiester phosphodiesterase [Sediminihaliea albiluteola]